MWFPLILAISGVYGQGLPPPYIPAHQMKLSEEFYPETARDVIIDTAPNMIAFFPKMSRRALQAHQINTSEKKALGDILLHLRYLYLLTPPQLQASAEQWAEEYTTGAVKLFQAVRNAARGVLEVITMHPRTSSEKRQFCEMLRKATENFDLSQPEISPIEKITIITLKMTGAIQTVVDAAIENLFTAPAVGMSYKFANIERLAEMASIMLQPLTGDISSESVMEMSMCVSL